jgi:cytoskeleton protein RodZ
MMTGRESAGAPFNEQAALEELERLQRAIEESRRQRGQSVEEFDAFVRSFKNPAPERTTTAPPMAVSAPRPAPAPAIPAAIPPDPTPLPEIVAAADPVPPLPIVDVSEPVVRPRGRQLGFRTLIAGLAAIAVVVVAAVLLLNRRGAEDAGPTSQPPQSVARAPVTTPGAAPRSVTPAPQPAPGGGIQVEIVTLRPVWVRVLVDGERAVERELRGNDRIPLRARRSIAIRAGDAGALRVMVAGQDQGTLGRDGEVVSRTFTAQPARPPAGR